MREITDVKEIQDISFAILKHFKEYCEENKIRYFLSGGTLLGAVKYKGFIPWDDDIDVFVPREDYDRLVREYKDNERFSLLSVERNPKYLFPFAKLSDNTTAKKEFSVVERVEQGIDIDVFPLDNFGADEKEALNNLKKKKRALNAFYTSKLIKLKGKTVLRTIVKAVYISLLKIVGRKKFLKVLSIPADVHSPKYVGRACWPFYGENEIIPAEVFEKTVEIVFKGETFSAPAGYDIYLKCLYGDYMGALPMEERVSHHLFKAYKK